MKIIRLSCFLILILGTALNSNGQDFFGRKHNKGLRSLFRGSHHTGKRINLKTDFIGTSDGNIHDLRPTLLRIKNKGKHFHHNDGGIFENNEGLLPKRKAGYYREYVHPTPGLHHAGKMRIVKGKNGKMWFTKNHYESFIPIRGRHGHHRKH